jgi:hypothetical protein
VHPQRPKASGGKRSESKTSAADTETTPPQWLKRWPDATPLQIALLGLPSSDLASARLAGALDLRIQRRRQVPTGVLQEPRRVEWSVSMASLPEVALDLLLNFLRMIGCVRQRVVEEGASDLVLVSPSVVGGEFENEARRKPSFATRVLDG